MSGPHISIPRPHGRSTTFGSTAPQRQRAELRMPRFFKRLFKFPQMDFEMATWEMTHLLYAPRRVFKSIYYHRQTNKTWHRPDPSFTYLLSFFLLLTSLAWSLAYSPKPWSIVKLAFMFIFVHFLASSLVWSVLAYLLVGRFLNSPDRHNILGWASRARRRQQGLFSPPPPRPPPPSISETDGGVEGGRGPRALGRGASAAARARANDPAETLEFGYCFDVTIRAFLPVYVSLYVVQFALLPVLARANAVSTFFANSLYLTAACYWTVITFLGYNTLPFLYNTQVLLLPLVVWLLSCLIATLTGWNMAEHVSDWMFLAVDKA